MDITQIGTLIPFDPSREFLSGEIVSHIYYLVYKVLVSASCNFIFSCCCCVIFLGKPYDEGWMGARRGLRGDYVFSAPSPSFFSLFPTPLHRGFSGIEGSESGNVECI